MRHFYRPMLFIVLLLMWAIQIPPTPAFACTPPPGGLPQFTAADRTKAATIVLEGTITHGISQPGWPKWAPQEVTVEVQQYLKGNGPAVVTIDGLGPDGLCLSQVKLGDHLIFYTRGIPESGLHANYLSQFDAVASVTPQLVAEITAAAGQLPAKPISPSTTPKTYPSSTSITMNLLILVSVVDLLICIGAGIILLWVKRQSKSQQ